MLVVETEMSLNSISYCFLCTDSLCPFFFFFWEAKFTVGMEAYIWIQLKYNST